MAEAKLSPILTAVSGKLGNFVFRVTRNGIVLADVPSVPPGAPTAEQLAVQAFFSTASKAWKNLTDAQREGWKQYAAAYFPTDKDGQGSGPNGQAVFNKAAWYLLAQGSAAPTAAPSAAPPPGPTAATLLNSPSDTVLTIRLTHSIATVAGFRVFIEITPPLASAARQAESGDFRAVRGIGINSFPALVASATSYLLSPVRFSLPNGARFGLRATILSSAGIPGPSFTATLTQVTP